MRATTATVTVGAGAGSYPVLISSGLLSRLPELLAERVGAHRYAVVSDDNVAPLYGSALVRSCQEAGLQAELFTVPAGEASKTRKSWSILTDALLDGGYGRDACVVAVGGGMTTDLAGFVAATYMRGLPLVQVPTSYLAMIDASVGAKTGVDTRHGKNLVGAFHRPRFVAADPNALATLPGEERAQGLVEAFKHGAILDADHFEWLSGAADRLLAADPGAAAEAVTRSVELKAGVVTEDEHEAGYRQVLNFGHTVGHALEAASGLRVSHGSAVALGMVAEARVGERVGVTAAGTAERLAGALRALLGDVAHGVPGEVVERFLGADKKAREGRARYVLLSSVGRVDPGRGWVHEVDTAVVRDVLDELLGDD